MSEPQVTAGQVLGGRYVLEEEIGRGGMATVHRALDRQCDSPVAVKILSPDLSPLLGADRFTREIRIAASLQHPNIVPLYDSGNENGELYYVMPLIEGETLRARLKRETQLPLADAIRIARDVLDALGHAHAQGVVHRDIKPENILLTAEKAMVTDFGIAKAIDVAGGERFTSSGLTVGTPPYMSPEQSGGEGVVDGRSDLYALACVLYEMVGGEPPFTGPTPQVILARQMHEAPRSLRVARPTVPVAFQAVVERGLAKVPADRFASAAAFSEALADALARPGWAGTGRVSRWAARTLMGLGAAAVGGLLWWGLIRPRPLNANWVVVYPLVSRGIAGQAGEDVALLIGSALEHTEPLRWIDGWGLLEPGVRADAAALSSRVARRIARGRRARWYVDGDVLRSGDSLTVVVRLNDVTGDSVVARESAGGPADAVPAQLALGAVTRLLPKLVGRSTHVAEQWLAGHRPGAVALWLQGERAYRSGRYADALALYRRALVDDPALTVAAVKAAMSASWIEQYPLGDTLARLALRAEAGLPPRNQRLLRGLGFFFAGEADSALAWFRSAVAADPEWTEGWYGVGEVYLHLLPSGTGIDSLAEDAFARAVQIDPTFAPAVFHLAELKLARGDLAAGGRLVSEIERLGIDSAQRALLDAMRACQERGPGAVDWDRQAVRFPEEVLSVARQLAGGMRRPDCAAAGFRAVLRNDRTTRDPRWSAMEGVHHLLIAQGDPAHAVAFVDSQLALGRREAEALLILDATLGVAPDARAAAVLAPFQGRIDHMAGYLRQFFTVWYVHRGDLVRMDSLRVAFRASSASHPEDVAWAQAVEAHLALARGDTAGAVSILTSLRPVAGASAASWNSLEPMSGERLLLADLLAATGRAADALDVADQLDRPLMANLVHLRASLELRARAAAAGRSTMTERYRARLRALTSRP